MAAPKLPTMLTGDVGQWQRAFKTVLEIAALDHRDGKPRRTFNSFQIEMDSSLVHRRLLGRVYNAFRDQLVIDDERVADRTDI